MKKNKPIRTTLTFYFSLTVFLILTVTMIIVGFVFYLLSISNLISFSGRPNYFFFLLTLAISSILIGTLFAYTIGNIPLRPFRTIILAMNKITKGDYSVKLNFEYPKELKDFSDSFNLMTKELNNTEILRSDFINSFSHEFKTPIISIKGFSKLLKNKNLSDEEKEEYLNIIIDESERLTELSTNILNLTKLENTAILTGTEPCNLAEQIRKCIILLEEKWEKKQLEFDLNLIEATIIGNIDLLQQVWINLLDNAIKFSNPDATIHIMMIETESSISIIIKDEGLGMQEEQIQRIFRKFYQTDAGQKKGGNGLGLNIAKRIIELHHGNISVESKINQGSSFTISLPKN